MSVFTADNGTKLGTCFPCLLKLPPWIILDVGSEIQILYQHSRLWDGSFCSEPEIPRLILNVVVMSCFRVAWQSLPCYTVVAQLGFKRSTYCRAKVEFKMINLVRHGSSTTFETGLSTDDIFREGKLLDRQPFWFGRIKLSTLPVGGVLQCVEMCMVLDDSTRTNYVTSLITFYLRLGLLRRFWRRTERTLECNKCSVEYLQHFCYVLRFASTLRFTLRLVHKTFELVRSVPAININKICKKNPSITNQSIIVTRQSAIGFLLGCLCAQS